MKKTILFFLMIGVAGLCLSSCNGNKETRELCPRNEYSRNGVKTVFQYDYDTKEGVVDTLSRKLYCTQQYDSLGNVIYYKGEHYPSIGNIAFSTYHYDIREALGLPWDMTYTYKMEYQDTIFKKASLFDKEGKLIARIVESIDGNKKEDSIFVSQGHMDKLITVSHIYLNVDGRDSLVQYYGNELGDMVLNKEERSVYYQTDSILREETVYKERDLYKQFRTHTMSFEVVYDNKGRIIQSGTDNHRLIQKYDDNGCVVESVLVNQYKKRLFKSTYYNNGLHKNGTTFDDMTVCSSYSEYEYEFYPYSPYYKKGVK